MIGLLITMYLTVGVMALLVSIKHGTYRAAEDYPAILMLILWPVMIPLLLVMQINTVLEWILKDFK